MIIDAIGSTESGVNGMAVQARARPRRTAAAARPCRTDRDTVVLDDDLRPLPPGSGVVGKLARGGNIPLGYYKDPEKTAATFVTSPDGERYVDPRRLRHGRGRRHDHAARPRLGVHQLGRREDLPRRGRGRAEVPSRRVRRDRRRRARRALGPAVAAVVEPRRELEPPTLATSPPTAAARSPAYKTPRHLVLVDQIVRSPSGKPDYPWATRLADRPPAWTSPPDV